MARDGSIITKKDLNKQTNRKETIPLMVSNFNREKNNTASLAAAAAAFLPTEQPGSHR